MKPFTPEEKEKFEKIKELVLGVVKRLDNNKKLNTKRYTEMFDIFEADPDAFRKWDMLNNDELDSAPQIFALPFEEPHMSQIKDAADFLGLPLEEYIYYRFDGEEPLRCKSRVPVGYVHIKRMQQILSKKNHYALDAESRSLKTGDVTKDDKVASLSDVETYALAAIGAEKSLEELLGPRADNAQKKQEMYRQIARDGYCTLEDLKDADLSGNTTLNTINTYLLASGIRSDLINNTMKTDYTIKRDLERK